MDDKQLDKLYAFLEERFDAVDQRIDDLEERHAHRFDRVETTLDGIVGRLDSLTVEQHAIKSQLDRHDHWHHQTADKLGLKLDYS